MSSKDFMDIVKSKSLNITNIVCYILWKTYHDLNTYSLNNQKLGLRGLCLGYASYWFQLMFIILLIYLKITYNTINY